MSNLERNSNRLREVQDALCRIDAGTFGVCVGCEEDINPKRLGAVPWAPRCIVCQEAADREQKTPRYEIDAPLATAA
jgi:DnaK suppressor protein